VNTEGDAFFVAFADPTQAVRACVQAQRELFAEPWPADAVIRVRMGLHTGFAAPHADDYIAFAVHQAARIVDAAHGGQIVASADTANECDGCEDVELVSLGRYRVRDFDDPVEVFEVRGPDLPSGFPPLRVLPADRHNLVAPLGALAGRSDELANLGNLLSAARLVSVIGPGGLGKTRLVVEYGLRHAGGWEHGAWFVDLAPLREPALIPQAVAEGVGVRPADGQTVWEAVLELLERRHALVMMDNCEHLTASIARYVEELLGACPSVKVIATSREPLGLRSERVWRLPALAADGPAIELFNDRAGLSGDLPPAAVAAIGQLCRLLDGLPLAIELAAARCDVLTPEDILARLAHRHGLLRSRDPTVPTRQHSLASTIDWSYHLLGADEQAAFRRLGVFSAGFGLDSASAVVGDSCIDRGDVDDLV
jgi:hypothetical protein